MTAGVLQERDDCSQALAADQGAVGVKSEATEITSANRLRAASGGTQEVSSMHELETAARRRKPP
jgi:hypothetical protein